MAWNRSKNGEAASSPLQGKGGMSAMKRRGRRFPVRGAIAGGLVVLGAVVAAWWLWPNGESGGETPPPRSARRIKAVEPAAAAKVGEAPKKPMTEAERIFAETNGMSIGALRQWEFKNWKGNVYTNRNPRVKTLEEKVFANGAERKIAGLLRIEPGEPLIGDSKLYFNERFLKHFKQSLVEPTIVLHDDTEEVKELKRAVNEAKAELKARMDKGEDICQLLADTRDEMRALGLYREELQRTVKESIRDGNLSDEDAQLCVDAANKMLAERGAKPLKMPTMYMKMLKLRNSKQKEENK